MSDLILGPTLADDMLRLAFGETAPAWTKDASVFFSLMTEPTLHGQEGDPDEFGGPHLWLNSEVSAADYARAEVPQTSLDVADGVLSVFAEGGIQWTTEAAEAWGTVVSIGCWRTATGTDDSDLIFAIDLDAAKEILAGDDAVIGDGGLLVRINGANVWGVQPT